MWNANARVSTGQSFAPGAIAGPTASGGAAAWHPTVLYLLALVAAEIVAIGFVSRHLLE